MTNDQRRTTNDQRPGQFRRPSSVVRRPSSVVRRPSLVVGRSSLVTLSPCHPVILSCLILLGCSNPQKPIAAQPPPPPSSAPQGVRAAPIVRSAAGVKRPVFDSKQAWAYLIKQCDFGPRPVGSNAHQKTRDWLLDEMRKYADKTVAQDFTYKNLPLTNVIGVFNPGAKKQILLLAHWDTRPRADQEIDPAKKRQPIIGASDGASGVAVLLELARNLKEQKPDVCVIINLVDGEDYGFFTSDPLGGEGVLLGAKYFAKHHEGYHPEFGILLDMVGDKNLDIYREPSSQAYAPGTNAKFFSIARELGYGKYIIDEEKTPITDDHTPLNAVGIPTIDIIDFDYGPWHTLDDTPDKCSAESLGIVGNTLAELVYREK